MSVSWSQSLNRSNRSREEQQLIRRLDSVADANANANAIDKATYGVEYENTFLVILVIRSDKG
jgi:hypothetical protein